MVSPLSCLLPASRNPFWKKGKAIGVYNRLPLSVQEFVGGERIDVPKSRLNSYFRPVYNGLRN
jgi:hypothetical protein